MSKHLKFCALALFFSSTQVMAAGGLKPKTALFMVPSVGGSSIENVFDEIVDTEEEGDVKKYTISIPVKQDDGTYKLVDITYTEDDDTRSITVPGQGTITVVRDEDGDYNFELTPEDINNSDNVTCSVGTEGKGTCTIEPFVTMVGDKVLSSDKLVVDYTEGENLVIAEGSATNLKLTAPDSNTNFNKSETDAGDTQVYVKLGKEETEEKQSINIGGLDLPVPNIVSGILSPFTNIDKKNMQIGVDTSKLVHTVSNPANPSQSATKFQVKDGGVSANVLIDGKEHTKIVLSAATHGGVTYNSNPFSDKTVIVDTTAPVSGSFNVDNDPLNPMASLSLAVAGKDKNGERSELTIVDTRSDKKTNTITSYGETFVNLAQATEVNKNTLEVKASNNPVSFEVGSEHLFVKREDSAGKVTDTEIVGLYGQGLYDAGKNTTVAGVVADSASIKKTENGKLSYELGIKGLELAMEEGDTVKKREALVDHAYYNDGETELNLADGAFIRHQEFKDSNTAQTFNGKPIATEAFVIGSKATLSQGDDVASFDGGVALRYIDYHDNSKLITAGGNQGSLRSSDYNVQLSDGFSAIVELDKDGNNTFTRIAAANLSGSKDGDQVNLINSISSKEIIGKNNGKDILLINHSSEGAKFQKGDGSLVASSQNMNLALVDANKVKYAQAKFDNLDFKIKEESVVIAGAEAAIYIDESDPTNKIKQGELELGKLGAKGVDYAVDIIAKDKDGNEGKYKIVFYEDALTKNYKVFAENGRRVYFDGVDKNNRHASVVLEAVEYLETDKFKSVLAKNISGSLEDLDPKNSKLQTFNIGRVAGIESLDGNYKQYSFENGNVSQTQPGELAHVDFDSIDYTQSYEDGNKSAHLQGKGINAGLEDSKRFASVNGLNIQMVEANNVKFGSASFDKFVFKDKSEDKSKFEVAITGAQAAIYIDETDPENKIKQGEFELSKLGAIATDYAVDVIAIDDKGVEGKYKIVFYEDGKNKNYKIFAEDGKRVYLDGKDQDNRHAKALFESIEYLESDKFKSILAINISGTLETIKPNSHELLTFNAARVEAIESLDGAYKQYALEKGKLAYKKDEESVHANFDSLELIQTKENGENAAYLEGKNVNASFDDGKRDADVKGLNLQAIDSKSVKYGAASFDKLVYKDKEAQSNREVAILGAQAAVYTDETDPSNIIRQGELAASKLGARESDYAVEIIAKDDQGVEGKFKVFIYEDGSTQNIKVFAEDGKRVYLEGSDKNNRHAKVLLEAIEYLETDEFKVYLAKNISGSLETLEPGDEKLISFNAARLEGVESLDGSFKQFIAEGAEVAFDSTEDGTTQSVELNGLNAFAAQENAVKYGSASFENLSYKEGGASKREVQIVGAQAAFAIDETDPSNKIQQGELELSKIGVKEADYQVDIIAKDADGVEGKYKILISENGEGKYTKIFAEDGRRVHFDGMDKDNRHASVVLDSIEYMESKDFKQVLATNLAGSLETLDKADPKLQSFSFGKIEGLESKDGSLRAAGIEDGFLSQHDKKGEAEFKFKKASFNQSNTLDAKELQAGVFEGVVNYVQYKDELKGKASGNKMEASLNFGSVLYNEVTDSNKEKITMLSAKDLDIIAVDYEELIKLNGTIGGVDFFENASIQSIQATDLKNLKVEDLDSGVFATLNGEKILRVVNKDKNGKEIGSYLLMKSTFLNASDLKNGINANLRVGVLELLQDKASGMNIILEADLDGKVTLDKTKSPIGGEVNFALKGKNLTTENHSFVSDDGNTVTNYFAIKAINAEGRLDKLELSAGPSFLKDAISIKAKGGKNGGKSLNFTFNQDKERGTYYIRAEFVEGEKVKVKLFPFTLESKIQGGDALAEILITPKGQNYMNHLEIISSVVSAQEITDWLEVSDGGMLIARTGTLGGVGFEMMYQDQERFVPPNEFGFQQLGDKADSYGAGIYYENAKGDRTSAGVMLTGDSEFQYQTNGRGVLKVFGFDMAKDGRIPATVNLYMKKDWADGDSIYGGVSLDTTSYAVDEERLGKDAAYFDGDRSFGRAGATVAYSKKLNKHSTLTFAVGANNNFSEPAACITYSAKFGAVERHAKDTMEVINKMPVKKPDYFDTIYGAGPTMKGAHAALSKQMKDLELKYEDAKALEAIQSSLDGALKALENENGAKDAIAKLADLSQKEFGALERLEREKLVPGKHSTEIKALVGMAKSASIQKRSLASVYEQEHRIRNAMEALTQEFEHDSSSRIYELYQQKVQELSQLK